MTPFVDVCWPLSHGELIPLHHQYHLLASVSRLVPDVHHCSDYAIHPIRGVRSKPGVLDLTAASKVRIRCPADKIPQLLPLNGKKLELADCPIRLGVAEIHTLQPSTDLYCHLATIKGYIELGAFALGVRRQLDTIGVSDSVLVEVGPRRVLHVKHQIIVGFQLVLRRLQESESLLIQERGLGGRRHFGCGLFDPEREQPVTARDGQSWRKQ